MWLTHPTLYLPSSCWVGTSYAYIYKYLHAVCPAGGNIFTCGKCRIQGVADSKRCVTIEMARAHYAGVKHAPKRVRKAQAKA